MKRLNETYKQILNETDYGPSVWDPNDSLQPPPPPPTYQQDVTYPNISPPDSITPDSPPGWDQRFRDREAPIKPWKPNPNFRGWDQWPPYQPLAPGMWPRPFGVPLPRNPPPGWPNDLQWPPLPGDPIYDIIYEFFYDPIANQWGVNPIGGNNPYNQQGWSNLSEGLRIKILKSILGRVQLYEYDPEGNPSWIQRLGPLDLLFLLLAFFDGWAILALEVYNVINPEAQEEHEAGQFVWQFGSPYDIQQLPPWSPDYTNPQHWTPPWLLNPGQNNPNAPGYDPTKPSYGNPSGWYMDDNGNWQFIPNPLYTPNALPPWTIDPTTYPPRYSPQFYPQWSPLDMHWIIPGPGGNGYYYWNPDTGQWVPAPRDYEPTPNPPGNVNHPDM